MVSAIFLLPVWRETAAGRRFSPFLAIIVRVIASVECQCLVGRHATSDDVTSGVAQTGSSF